MARIVGDSMIEVSIANELFRREKGRYAQTLDELKPVFIPAVPQDWFENGTLKYQVSETGFVVYSAGPDGFDNGGIEISQKNRSASGDLVIRIGDPGK
jgi:hypothetical protein